MDDYAAAHKPDTLDRVHDDNTACRVCEAFAQDGYRKPAEMMRGDAGRIAIVGQNPGRQEVLIGRAFSGPAGRRLDEWLRGTVPENTPPRQGVYLTATVKCLANERHYTQMLSRCHPFLRRQLAILRPVLVITLGARAFNALRFDSSLDYRSSLCTVLSSKHFLVVPPLGVHFDLMPWPHPSGLNRDLNDEYTQKRLSESFDIVAALRRETTR